MNASKLGTNQLPGWRGGAKICSKSVRFTQPELHSRLLLQYTSAMTAIVNQLNINGDARDRMFERWTPPSMVLMHFLGGEEIAKICSKSVHRTQPELHTRLLLQYTSVIVINWISMEMLFTGCSKFKRWTPPSLVPINFLCGQELAKNCSKSVRPTQLELHTCLLLQYTHAMTPLVNKLIINGDAPDRMLQALYHCTS